MEKPKIIAFYLPQYHPFKENDEWWGKGFTEWTNVAKAKRLYPGHYQPKIPSELGFYDLRLPEIREQQAELAQEAGVYGFCYWHYWFGNGKRLMETVFNEVLATGKPNFPFCLGWANHSWYAKLWNTNGVNKDKLLIEQTYPGNNDIDQHFQFLLKAFRDSRYIKINNAPLFYIFNPSDLPFEYVDRFQKLAKENGFENGLYIIANITQRNQSKEYFLSNGYSAVTYQRLSGKSNSEMHKRIINRLKRCFCKSILRIPRIIDYRKASRGFIDKEIDVEEDVIPTIIPNWDHTPRSGINGFLLKDSTPEAFAVHVDNVLELVEKKKNKLIFLKSWNEWGEGNYMEPDLKFGRGYVEAIHNCLERKNILK